MWAGTQTPSLPVAHTLRLLTKCLAVIVALNLIPCLQAIKRDFGVDAAQIRRVLGLWQVGPAALALCCMQAPTALMLAAHAPHGASSGR